MHRNVIWCFGAKACSDELEPMNHLKVDLGQGALIKKNIAVFCVLAGGGVKCCDLK